jgi:predicted ArsR family transcriptional regulator
MNLGWLLRLQPEERLATPILLRELGVLGVLQVGRTLRRRQRLGEPFTHLPPADCDQETLSRQQIGPAILLYQALTERVGQPQAYAITRAVVIEAACDFLRRSIGPLRRTELEALDENGRQAWVLERGRRFFNATVYWDEITGDRVRFTVTHCRFPPLCHACGVPELAPVFCEGDAVFFGTVEPDVTLDRPHTRAKGAATCPFTLSWQPRPTPHHRP